MSFAPVLQPGYATSSESEFDSDPDDPQLSQLKASKPIPGEVPLSESESDNETWDIHTSQSNANVSSSSKKTSKFVCSVQQGEVESESEEEVQPSKNIVTPGIVVSDSESDSDDMIPGPYETDIQQGVVESESEEEVKPSKNIVTQGIAVSDSESESDDMIPGPYETGIQQGVVESEDSDSEPEEPIHTATSKTAVPTSTFKSRPVNPTPPIQKPPPKETFNFPQEFIDAFREQTLQPYTHTKKLKEKAKKLLKFDPITFACCVCTENYYKTDEYGKCSSIFNGNKKRKVIHTICRQCLIQATYLENVSLDQQGRGIKCPLGDCENVLLMSEVQQFMEEGHREQLIENIGNFSIAAANISNLYRCPNCAIAVIVDEEKPCYQCHECKRINCKNCDREYVGDHEGRTCQELIEYERKMKNRAAAAAKINEIAVHRCHRCNIQFVKLNDGSCNKMTCKCGATQCYLCGAKDITYDHFGQNKPCQLFTDAHAIEERKLAEERRRQGLND